MRVRLVLIAILSIIAAVLWPTAAYAAAPTAALTVSPDHATSGAYVGVYGYNSCCNIVNYQFDFGDGNSVSQSDPWAAHYYYNYGSSQVAYTVRLTVTDGNGATNSTSLTEYVSPDFAPVAHLTVSNNNSDPSGLSIYADATASTDADPDGFSPPNYFSFDFGDGSSDSGNSGVVGHKYASAGTYTVQVTVYDTQGNSDANSTTQRNVSVPITAATVPAAPTSIATSKNDSARTATLTWQPPASNGGSPITGYRVARDGVSSGGLGPWSKTVGPDARSQTFNNLAVGSTYTLSVEAINAVGTGPAASGQVTIGPTTPGAPLSVVGSAGDKQVAVSWAPPASTGGATITGYVATASPGGANCSTGGAATTCTVTGLANGAPYTFTVTASNAVGKGAASAPSAAVTPSSSDHQAPVVLLQSPTGRFATAASTVVRWRAIDAGGGVVGSDVRYRVATWRAPFGPFHMPTAWRGRTNSAVRLSGLVRGSTYCFSVRATDRAGNRSGWSRERCVSRPLDDRALKASKGWRRTSGLRYYGMTISMASRRGVSLTLAGVRCARVAIMATTGPGRGTLVVRHAGVLVGRLRLDRAFTTRKDLLTLPLQPLYRGALSITVISHGKPVQIDGLAVAPR